MNQTGMLRTGGVVYKILGVLGGLAYVYIGLSSTGRNSGLVFIVSLIIAALLAYFAWVVGALMDTIADIGDQTVSHSYRFGDLSKGIAAEAKTLDQMSKLIVELHAKIDALEAKVAPANTLPPTQ